MSRQIDWTKPVTGADRAWAEQFEGAHSQLLAANDAAHASASVEESQVGDKPNYDSLTKEQLVAEIERRNKEYGPEYQMATSGTKADLIARLVEDDQDEEVTE